MITDVRKDHMKPMKDTKTILARILYAKNYRIISIDFDQKTLLLRDSELHNSLIKVEFHEDHVRVREF